MKKRFILFLLIMCISVCFIILLQKENKIKEYSIKENIELAIYLEDEQTNTIPNKESGYYYDREKSTCTNGAYINWDSVSWSPVVSNMNEYKTRCEIHFTKTYTEGILNGTDPILRDELVPVTIEENGTVKKANLESEWYSYANKNWANSVILDDQYDTLNSEGKVVGATKSDGYVTLDGVDDYVDLGLESYDFLNGITYSLIFYLTKYNTLDHQDILGNWEKTKGGGISVNEKNSFEVVFAINNQWIVLETDYILELDKRYHIVVTNDNQNIKIYVNGNLIFTKGITGEIGVSEVPIYLGSNPESDGSIIRPSNVNVENVQIYDRALDEEEIPFVSEGKVANSEGLLRYVDFTNKSYEANEIIPEEKIESYFVWIPKYRYQLWDLGNYDSLTTIDESKVHEIPIIFGDYNTSDEKENECTTPMESGKTGNCQIGDYMTHPAFISIPSTGFWVGKFETGYDGATTQAEAQQNINDSSKIIIKPNVYSWRGIQVANAFYSSFDYQRNLDSHMMKNTEWGAVAYLQHSAYGSQTSIRINNNNSYLTGYQANNEPTCGFTASNEECNRYCNDGTCNTAYPNSGLASTTGNISGIYDMSGGVWEFVMAFSLDRDGYPYSGRNSINNSGFNGNFSCSTCDNDTSGLTELTTGYNFPDLQYFDQYNHQNKTNFFSFTSRILGDATGEMGPFQTATYNSRTMQISSWYKDQSYMFADVAPLFFRSGKASDGSDTGIFGFAATHYSSIAWIGFRLVLSPIKSTS